MPADSAQKNMLLAKAALVIGDDQTQSFGGGYVVVAREPKHDIVAVKNFYAEL